MPYGTSGMSGPLEFTLVTGPGSLIFLNIPKATPTNPHSDIHHPKTKPGVQSPFYLSWIPSPRFKPHDHVEQTTIDINCTCTKEPRSDNRKSKKTTNKNKSGRPTHTVTPALKQFISVLENPFTTLQFANSLAETPAPPLPITHES